MFTNWKNKKQYQGTKSSPTTSGLKPYSAELMGVNDAAGSDGYARYELGGQTSLTSSPAASNSDFFSSNSYKDEEELFNFPAFR